MAYARHVIGKKGEKLARKFLRSAGMKILQTNYRSRPGELDIIAMEKDTIVFVEVKTTSADAPYRPEDEFTSSKKKHFARAAVAYVKSKKLQDKPLRLDFLGIQLPDSGEPEIRHVKGALNPGDVLPGLY